MPTVLTADDAAIAQAARVLRNGGLVAFPTETVYGLGADACNGAAVARVFDVKGRPSFNPLIVHVPDTDAARALAKWSDAAEKLSAQWPGALTLVLPLREGHGLSGLVTAGLGSVGLRVPTHPVARGLLRKFGGPVAAPSANLSGRLSPTRASHVAEGLGDHLDLVLDGGPAKVGVESTIVSLLDSPCVLRPGGTALEILETALGQPVPYAGSVAKGETPRLSPGQLSSHYAPRSAVRLNAIEALPGEVLLGFGKVAGDVSLSSTGDLVEAAAQLFELLHQLDARGGPIAVAPIPERGLGVAINDRLRRAAAPRA